MPYGVGWLFIVPVNTVTPCRRKSYLLVLTVHLLAIICFCFILTLLPITTSAKKALRQNKTRHTRNVIKKEAYKKAVVDYRKLVAAKKFDEAAKALPAAFKALDKAAKTNVIEKNKASRLKSRLAQLINRSTKASS